MPDYPRPSPKCGVVTLTPGRYLVYVWPGLGAKSAVDYGPLLGWTSFWMK